jgi:A/G-specific adenine glycosylase
MPASHRIARPIRDAILAWFAERGRPLAFRRTSDPWAILVSEAMAQQTQAARAAAYWERFIERFPTPAALAAATPADVLRAWQGLGYDRRALALRRAATLIESRHGGRVPSNLAELQALPGVGPYTARAVAALAFGAPVGAVDVNVRRVLGRIVAGDPERLTVAELQAIADDAVPTERPGEWTHAVMDVGATLCRPRAPRCPECPARPSCRYAREVADPGRHRRASADLATPLARDRPALEQSALEQPAQKRPAFTSTTRWLRGRILDRLRAADDGAWTLIDGDIGSHDAERVRTTLQAMVTDGLVELRGGDGPVLARLPLA